MSIFNELLATEKLGGVERPDQQQMEIDFSQMAFQFVLDRAPSLAPYGIGFEIVERDDEGSKVCGIFGYKIGAEFYMIAVFFINGQIKGINSLYSKSTNMLSPLTEKVINKAISRSTIELGTGVSRSSVQRNLLMPSLANFKALGSGGTKFASVLREMWDSAKAGTMQMLENDPKFQQEVASALIKKAGTGELEPFEGSSDLIAYLKATGPKAVQSFLGAVAGDSKLASAVVDLYGSVTPFMIEEFDKGALEFRKQAAEQKKVEIVYRKQDGCCCDSMSSDDMKRMVRDGFRIIDRRKPNEISELYDVEYPMAYNPPDKPGLYNMLLASGVTTEAWLLRPFSADKRGLMACVETDKKCLAMALPKDVFARDGMIPDSKTAYEAAVDLDSMKVKGRYLIVNEAGNYLGPVTVEFVINEPGKRTNIKVDWEYFSRDYDNGLCSPCSYGSNPQSKCASDCSYLELVPEQSGQPRISGDKRTVILPTKGLKALELNSAGEGEAQYPYLNAEKESFKPGNPMDIYALLYNSGFSKIALHKDLSLDGLCRINDSGVVSEPVSYKTAFVTLVSKYGYSVADADEAVTEMDVKGMSGRFAHVKLAQDSSGVSIPWLQLPEFQGSDAYSGMMTQTPQSAEAMGFQPQSLPPQEPFMPGMADGTARQPTPPQPDAQALQIATDAANSGQKTVFDHAGIAGLAKLYDVNPVIDSYIPEMTKALDRIGRILFLFQWKSEEFVDRFGADSMPDMEDELVSVYKSFGDLVLNLRDKAINPDESGTVNM